MKMNSKRLTVLAAAVAASVAFAGVIAPKWIGMITAQPAAPAAFKFDRDPALFGVKKVQITIVGTDGPLGAAVSKDALKEMIENRLGKLGIEVITAKTAAREFAEAKKGDDAAMLLAQDRYYCSLDLNLNSIEDKDSGSILYSMDIACARGVFVHPGFFTTATTWTEGILGRTASGNKEVVVIQVVEDMMDRFQSAWHEANGPDPVKQ